MIVIPMQPSANQIIKFTAAEDEVILSLRQTYHGMQVNINSNGVDVSLAVAVRNTVPLNARNTPEFKGALFIVDTLGDLDPYPSGLGERFQLVYSVDGT